ncbi:MAG: rhodanese-like domain-containing protein [Burkholderiales bacterium]
MQTKALDRRSLLHSFLILGLVLWIGSALQHSTKPELGALPVPEIAVLEAVAAIAKGATVIDVRSRDTYAEGHIAGAISMPLDELKQRAPELAAASDKEYIVYCGNGSTLGPQAAQALAGAGHPSTRNLPAGYSGWKAAGQAVATGIK